MVKEITSVVCEAGYPNAGLLVIMWRAGPTGMEDECDKQFLCVPGADVQAMPAHNCNLSTAGAEARGSRLAQGQLGLHSETLPQAPPTIAANC